VSPNLVVREQHRDTVFDLVCISWRKERVVGVENLQLLNVYWSSSDLSG